MTDNPDGRERSGTKPSVLLGGAFLKEEAGGDAMLFSDPLEQIELRKTEDLHSFFGKLDKRLADGFSLAGYLTYEAGYGFEPDSFGLPERGKEELPLAWFGVYRAPKLLPAKGLRRLLTGDFHFGQPVFDLTRNEYVRKIETLKRQISVGNVYQVNFTGRYRFPFNGSIPGFLGHLSDKQPGVYSAWLNLGTHDILSLSPELFFRCRENSIETRPMKGTSKRGKTPEDDRCKRDWLQADDKNRAENLMIVDLLRNDLGRICKPGSVRVPELFVTETYPTLHQMVSSVQGELPDSCSLYDLFRAVFPCGSVTGAPKIRAMQLIKELEDSPRGVYTGAIGFMLPDRSMCFNVAIRTLQIRGEQGEYGAGSGIVWDSKPEEEFDECRLKAKILESKDGNSFGIFETMLFSGSYIWMEEHLLRMERSAHDLGFSFNGKRIHEQLERLAESEFDGKLRYKVRFELQRNGELKTAFEELADIPAHFPVRVCRASVALDADELLRKHKTTRRLLYDEYFRRARAAGFDEVLFCNDRGEVTEGAISNVITRKNGHYYTPKLASGLLNGIYRQYFLATRPLAKEAILLMEDVEDADLFFICNSVRGLRMAVLCEDVV